MESTDPLCKWAYAAESIQRIPTLINIAIRKAVAGRPGPVYLDLPAEMISGSVDGLRGSYSCACARALEAALPNQTRSVRHWTSSDRPSARFS